MNRNYREWKDKFDLSKEARSPVINVLTGEWMSQSEIAKKAGLSTSSISHVMFWIRSTQSHLVELCERIDKPTLYRRKTGSNQ